MNLKTIGLWNCRRGQYIRNRMWNVPEDKLGTGKTAKFTLPIRGNGLAEWEIRAHASVNSFLELSGRQAMLLARLMDEFPLPEQEDCVVPETTFLNQAIPDSAVGTKTLLTSAYITFDESIPNKKIVKFMVDVDEAVEAACASSPFDDRGED